VLQPASKTAPASAQSPAAIDRLDIGMIRSLSVSAAP
jgi:hypothetical protein